MDQNTIEISETENKILDIVQTRFDLENKSQALALIVKVYRDSFLELEPKQEYLEKLDSLEKEEGIPFENMSELREIIED